MTLMLGWHLTCPKSNYTIYKIYLGKIICFDFNFYKILIVSSEIEKQNDLKFPMFGLWKNLLIGNLMIYYFQKINYSYSVQAIYSWFIVGLFITTNNEWILLNFFLIILIILKPTTCYYNHSSCI